MPLGTVGRELMNRGHQVTVVGTALSAPLAKQFGLSMYEWTIDHIPYPSGWVMWKLFSQFNAGWMIDLRKGYYRQAKILLELAPAALRELKVDGLLIDQTFLGGGSVAQYLELPYVTVCSALPWNLDVVAPPIFTSWFPAKSMVGRLRNRLCAGIWQWYMSPTVQLINRYRKKWKMPRIGGVEDEYSRLAQICQLCREFDFPRRYAPPTLHYAGPLAANRPSGDNDFPWDRLDGRPLIFASLGTVPDPFNLPILKKILAACAGVDAQLVLALGKWVDHKGPCIRERLGKIPGDPLIVDFAPQIELLEKAALAITHAGQNSAMEALSRAVPLVAVPRSADQPGVAARIEYSGAGLRAFFRTVTVEQLRQMIQRVLTEDSFRQRAKQLQQALIAAGGAPKAAEIAETALTVGRPVLYT